MPKMLSQFASQRFSPFGSPISPDIGKNYGRSIAPGFFETLRPFADRDTSSEATRGFKRREVSDPDDDSIIIWGGPPSASSVADATAEELQGGVTIKNPKPLPKEEEERQVVVRTYTEISRTTETVRVSNPSDPSQYVDVQRIKSIRFMGPQGDEAVFNLRPPK